MEITRDILMELAFEDWNMRARWLRVWTALAKEELKKEEPWEQIYGLLFWARVEAHRRRVYLSELIPELDKEPPEIELESARVLRMLEDKRTDESQKKKEKAREP